MDMKQGISYRAVAVGCMVVDSDGNTVGEIVAAERGYLVVKKGRFFPTGYLLPTSTIARHDGKTMYLAVPRGDALRRGRIGRWMR